MRPALPSSIRTPSAGPTRRRRRVRRAGVAAHRATRLSVLVALAAGVVTAGGGSAGGAPALAAGPLPELLALPGAPALVVTDPAVGGSFSAPFVEPTIDGQRTKAKCIK